MNDLKYLKESYRLWLGGITDFNSDEPLKKYKRIQSVARWTLVVPLIVLIMLFTAFTMDYDIEFKHEFVLILLPVFLFIWSLTLSSHIRRFKFRQKNYKSFLIVSLICYLVGFTFIEFFKNESWKFMIGVMAILIPGFMTNTNDVKTDRDELFERIEEDGN
ncbi:hypothetical protein [Macrococcus sp. DPC7161]|uniref:hypothetical protein n=1 Tax=Macrococcus sp. DPC7161 TaxID=2507060 RepID=UPI00100B9768|nr:hypothetical protein [Macrococcus sp. DPC7161]RXK18193.1 hypothetical protein ER639_05755 [Macrococcus sp. DPC7161]